MVGARKSRGHREGDGQQQTPRREIRDVDGVTVTVRFPSVTVTVVRELICGCAKINLLLELLSVISCAEHRADAVAM